MNALLEAAVQYAARGWPVFPLYEIRDGRCSCGRPTCTSPGKHPRTIKGFKDATTDRDKIIAWWAVNPTANIGISTGQSGLVILDVDGFEGQAELKALLAIHGRLPKTLTVRTGRPGGFHVYFVGTGITSKIDKQHHIDVRGTTGYVVAPPSNHISGVDYAWVDASLPPVPVPAWVAGWVAGGSRTNANTNAKTVSKETGKQLGKEPGNLAATIEDQLGPLPEHLKAAAPGPSVAQAIHRASLPPWSPEEEARLRSALAVIPANIDGRAWASFGFALHDLRWIVNGRDIGLEIWDDWSKPSTGKGKGNGEYKGRHDLEKRWSKFFESSYDGRRITIASIYHAARQRGWTDDRVPRVNSTDDVGSQKWHQAQATGQQGKTNQQRQAGQTDRDQDEAQRNKAASISATPFETFDFAEIPPRQWLFGRHYVRKYVTATVAPGGGAKTALKITEAVSMAVGRDLLDGNKAISRLRVWYWNGEDPKDEIDRRIAAVCLHYKIDPTELEGWLFVDNGHDMPICLATENRGGVSLNEDVINAINETLEQNKIDVMILDPFISLHRVSENNNPLIDQVVKLLGRIANRNNCAIEIVHHVRKPSAGQHEITADDTRGGGAIVNAVRSCQLLNRMGSKEAEQARIEQEQRFRYFRVDSGKQNLAPPEKAKWRYLHSIDLPNGDNVQVVESWKFPEPVNSVTQEEMEFVQASAREGIYNRWDSRAKYWIGRPLASLIGLDPQNKADRQDIYTKLNACRKNGMIAIQSRQDAQRRVREFVVPGPPPG